MQREMESASLAEVTDWSTCVYGKQEFAGAGKTNTGLLSILIGYSFLLPQDAVFNLILLLCVFSAFMFHVFLMLAAAEEFKVSFSVFGPTELRLALIIINGLLARFGVWPLKGALPYVAVCGTVAFALLAYRA